MGPNLTINIGELTNNSYKAVSFRGEFDKAGHSDIRERLDECVKSFAGSSLIFDFSDLKFINSEGIGYLMEIHTFLIRSDRQLVVVGLNAHIADVFEAIGFQEIIPVFDTIEDFLKNK